MASRTIHRHKCLHPCLCAQDREYYCVACAMRHPGADQDRIFTNRWPGRERKTDLRRQSLVEKTYLNTGRHPSDVPAYDGGPARLT